MRDSGHSGESEVADLEREVGGVVELEKNVLRLQVAVHAATSVTVVQTRTELASHFFDHIDWDLLTSSRRREPSALQILG